MKTLNLKALLTATVATVSTVVVAGQPVQAFSFTKLDTDWHIVLDSFSDGTTYGDVSINSDYQIFGMAAKVVNGEAYFAINSNLKREGKNNIGYGQLFLNFHDTTSFEAASAAEKLYAVHFGPNDYDDKNPGAELGLYKDVRAESVGSSNSGFGTWDSYQNKIQSKGGTVEFGDLDAQEAKNYLTKNSSSKVQNIMKTGTKVADDGFALLTDAELAGLDFGTSGPDYEKQQTIGFKFDASKLPKGDALISLLHECINDGMAMKAKFEGPSGGGAGVDVPEPTSIVSLGLIGLALAGSRLRKQDS